MDLPSTGLIVEVSIALAFAVRFTAGRRACSAQGGVVSACRSRPQRTRSTRAARHLGGAAAQARSHSRRGYATPSERPAAASFPARSAGEGRHESLACRRSGASRMPASWSSVSASRCPDVPSNRRATHHRGALHVACITAYRLLASRVRGPHPRTRARETRPAAVASRRHRSACGTRRPVPAGRIRRFPRSPGTRRPGRARHLRGGVRPW